MSMISIATLTQKIPTDIFSCPADLGQALATDIMNSITIATREGRRYLLGCPGGRSPQSTYQALGRLAEATQADLSQVVIVMMDEYLVPSSDGFAYCPADAHYSCHRSAREDIVGVINRGLESSCRIPDNHIWFPDPMDPASYDARIRAAGGIDFFILATGAGDGHVAFNPPGDPEDSVTRVIALPESTRRDNMVTFPEFTVIDDVPAYGVSIGLGTITSLSREVVLIAHGADKQYAVQRLAACMGFDPQWPASIIFQCARRRVLLDEAAIDLRTEEI